MKCVSCGKSCDEVMLHRTEPKGQNYAGWMCIKCIEEKENELADNIKEDEVLSDFDRIFYPHKRK